MPSVPKKGSSYWALNNELGSGISRASKVQRRCIEGATDGWNGLAIKKEIKKREEGEGKCNWKCNFSLLADLIFENLEILDFCPPLL
jgi:hypothetical protein